MKIIETRDIQPKRPLSCKRLVEYLSSQETQIKLLKGILCLCLILILLSLSRYYKYRNPVFSSEGYPSMLDIFRIFVMLSFAVAFCALIIIKNPKLAVLHRCYFILSMVSTALALSILAYALFLRLVTLVIKLFQSEGGTMGSLILAGVFAGVLIVVLIVIRLSVLWGKHKERQDNVTEEIPEPVKGAQVNGSTASAIGDIEANEVDLQKAEPQNLLQ